MRGTSYIETLPTALREGLFFAEHCTYNTGLVLTKESGPFPLSCRSRRTSTMGAVPCKMRGDWPVNFEK